MIKVTIFNTFYDSILETEMPVIPTVDETITLFSKNEYVEYDIKAVNYCFDLKNKFSFRELCVEQCTTQI